MNETIRRIRAVRRTMSKRERTLLVSSISYTCGQCLMSLRVSLARGVVAPDFRPIDLYDQASIPAPRVFPCRHCDGIMIFDEGSQDLRAEGLSVTQPYMRVPTRRGSIVRASERRFEAQLVIPEDPIER